MEVFRDAIALQLHKSVTYGMFEKTKPRASGGSALLAAAVSVQ